MKLKCIQDCVKIMVEDWQNALCRPYYHPRYHYAFAIKKNKIIAIGKNQPEYPHPKVLNLARTFNIDKWHHYPYLHAESDLITKLPDNIRPKQIEILSLRINAKGNFRMAKPCKNCQKMLDSLGVQKIIWSANEPQDMTQQLILQKQTKINLSPEQFVLPSTL
jgi:deoxycytidylate deaminase